ncbi:MAG: DinB family protein [Caldilineaceae bacterium]
MTSGMAQVFGALARQNAYANQILFQEASKLTLETLDATKSASRESAYRLLVHLLTVEALYFRQIKGGNGRVIDKEATTSLDSVVAIAAQHGEEFLEYVTTLTDEELGRDTIFQFSNGARVHYPVWQLLTQVLMHSAQHRGELSILLSELGHPLPINDIIIRFTEESGQPWPFK